MITDYQAFQNAFKKKDIHSRLARWFDFLAEYELEILYRPGSKNCAADFLSRLLDDEGRHDAEEGDLVCAAAFTHGDMLEDMEPHVQETCSYLEGEEIVEQDVTQRRRIKKNCRRFLAWKGWLLRRTKNGIRTIPSRKTRLQILQSLHEDIDHWDATATKQFVLDRYWCLGVHGDVYTHVRGM